MIDLPSEVAQLSPKLVGRFLILVGQGNPKGAVSGRVVKVSGVLDTVNGRFDELLGVFKFQEYPFQGFIFLREEILEKNNLKRINLNTNFKVLKRCRGKIE